MKKNQHVVPHLGKWGIRGEGNKKVTKKTKTQKEAIEEATEIDKNQKSELLIHKKEVKIKKKNNNEKDQRN